MIIILSFQSSNCLKFQNALRSSAFECLLVRPSETDSQDSKLDFLSEESECGLKGAISVKWAPNVIKWSLHSKHLESFLEVASNDRNQCCSRPFKWKIMISQNIVKHRLFRWFRQYHGHFDTNFRLRFAIGELWPAGSAGFQASALWIVSKFGPLQFNEYIHIWIFVNLHPSSELLC